MNSPQIDIGYSHRFDFQTGGKELWQHVRIHCQIFVGLPSRKHLANRSGCSITRLEVVQSLRHASSDRSLSTPAAGPRELSHESDNAWILRLNLSGLSKTDVTLTVNKRTLQRAAETPPERPFGGND